MFKKTIYILIGLIITNSCTQDIQIEVRDYNVSITPDFKKNQKVEVGKYYSLNYKINENRVKGIIDYKMGFFYKKK